MGILDGKNLAPHGDEYEVMCNEIVLLRKKVAELEAALRPAYGFRYTWQELVVNEINHMHHMDKGIAEMDNREVARYHETISWAIEHLDWKRAYAEGEMPLSKQLCLALDVGLDE